MMHISNQNDTEKTHIPKLESGQGIRVSTPSLSTTSNQDVCSGPPLRESIYSKQCSVGHYSVTTPKKTDSMLDLNSLQHLRSIIRAVTRPNPAYFKISDGHRALRDTAAGYFGLQISQVINRYLGLNQQTVPWLLKQTLSGLKSCRA